MLIRLDPHPPFDLPCAKRLIALEAYLRRRSEGQISVREYRSLLQDLGIDVPRSARTLQEDLRRYAAYCDDVLYGEHAKSLKLDPFVSHDAVACAVCCWRKCPRLKYRCSIAVCDSLMSHGAPRCSPVSRYASSLERIRGMCNCIWRMDVWRILIWHGWSSSLA